MSKAKKPPAKGKAPASPRIAPPRARGKGPAASQVAVDALPEALQPTPEQKAELEQTLAPFVPVDKVDPRAYVANDKDRAIVAMGRACALTDAQIAGLCGISETTLKKYYHEELHIGHLKVVAKVAANMAAIASQSADKKAAVTAGKFWLESVGGDAFKPKATASAEARIKKGQQEDDDSEELVFTLKIGDREPVE